MWLDANPLAMHGFIDERDTMLYQKSDRSDYTLALVFLRIVMYTDACHEWTSVTGYVILLQGSWGTRLIIRWRSSTTKLRSTSSTYSELEACHLGVLDFLPIWTAVTSLFGCHVEGLIYLDSESALRIIHAGFSKGLLWLVGVDRCTADSHLEAITGEDMHLSTTKGRTLKIQLLHDKGRCSKSSS